MKICEQMANDCQAIEPMKVLKLCDALVRQTQEAYPGSCCMFILTDGRQVLSTALLTMCNQISFRWTPPRHRKKGYCVVMTKMIEEAWKSTKVLPLWVCSNDYMKPLNEKAGWVNIGRINQDDTQDWFPSWCAYRYRERLEKSEKTGEDIVDTLGTFLKLNKNPNLRDSEDWKDFLKKFPSVAQRKKAQQLRL